MANPEFLMEGRGLLDFHYPDRILIGTSSERAKCIIRSLYEQVIQGITPGPGSGNDGPQSHLPVLVIEIDLAAAQMIN